MRKITILGVIAALGITLGGCNLPTLNIGNQMSMNTLEGVVSAYGLALNAESTYKALPLCKTGTVPSISNICAKRSIINRLIAADKTANAAVNQAVSFVKANPSVDPTQYLSAAQAAITAVQAVLSTASATGG
jgi:hypothetical protein